MSPERKIEAHLVKLAKKHGFKIVLSVRDEIISETPHTDEFSAKGLASLMAMNPAWARGLPLAAAGFEAKRYRKG